MRKKFHKLLQRAQKKFSLPFFIALSKKIAHKSSQIAKSTAYWTAVLSIGIGLSTVIFYVFDVPVVESAGTVSRTITHILAGIIYYLVVAPVGYITLGIVHIFEFVVTYPYGAYWQQTDAANGGFVNVSSVVTGWKLVRDICNIFFSVILVIIALATVLKIEKFQWKQLLPTFILTAILINFSKSICGVFTDAATVAMATFGGSFSDSFGRGLLGAFGVTDLLELSDQAPDGSVEQVSGLAAVIIGYLASAGMMTGFFVLITVFTLIIVFRIVMLWFLIVTSPMAYVTRVLPQTQSYADRWWKMFGRWVVVGPMITFFLWLTLSIAFGTDANTGYNGPVIGQAFDPDFAKAAQSQGATVDPTAGSSFKASTSNVMANFFIMAAMLYASLKLVLEMASDIGGILGKAQGLAYTGLGLALGKAGQVISSGGFYAANKFGSGAKYLEGKGRLGKLAGGGASLVSSALTGASFATAIAMQPQAYGKRMIAGYKEYSKNKQKKFREKLTQSAAGLRGGQIIGHGKGFRHGAANFFRRGAGALIGAGMDDAEEVIRNNYPLSIEAMAPKLQRAAYAVGSVAGVGPLARMNKLTKEVEKDKQTKDLIDAHNQIRAAENAGNTGQVDLNVPGVKLMFEEKEKSLRAEAERLRSRGDLIGATDKFDEANQLKDHLDQYDSENKEKALRAQENALRLDGKDREADLKEQEADQILAERTQRFGTGAFADGLVGASAVIKNVLDQELEGQKDAFEVDDNGNVVLDANGDPVRKYYDQTQGVFTQSGKEKFDKDIDKKQREAKNIRYQLGALQPEPGQLATLKLNEAIAKEYGNIKHIGLADEAEAELVGAIGKKNWNRVHALLNFMGEKSWLEGKAFRDIIADIDPKNAGTGFDGMKAFMDHLIHEGLDEQRAMSMMNEVITGPSNTNLDLKGAFAFDRLTGWKINDESARRGLQQFISKITSTQQFGGYNWSVARANGKVELAPSAMDGLIARSKEIAAKPDSVMRFISPQNKSLVKSAMERFQNNQLDLNDALEKQMHDFFTRATPELQTALNHIVQTAA